MDVEKTPRSPLELVMFAAWVNVPPEQVPAEWAPHLCDATRIAWGRVAAAAREHIRAGKPAAPLHTMVEAAARALWDRRQRYVTNANKKSFDDLCDVNRMMVMEDARHILLAALAARV